MSKKTKTNNRKIKYGAKTGTKIKTVIVNDIIFAIVGPDELSRIMACEITRGAEAPIPCRRRPNRSKK